MARNSSLHINIPLSDLQTHHFNQKNTVPESPGCFQPKNQPSFSFMRNGSQSMTSPCSIPFKMQYTHLPTPLANTDKCGLSEVDFPSQAGVKIESPYHSYLSHPFTQLRQQRLLEQQQLQQLKPKTQQNYVSKYANYTSCSQNTIQSNSLHSVKPMTTMTLSMTEKEKMTFQYASSYSSSRESLASPPPPYFYPNQGNVLSVDQTTPASLAHTKRNSLPAPTSLSTPSARSIKRHSLPSTSAGLQWPSAMTMTMAAVTRPKLARTTPLQTSILYNGDMKSPTAVFTPRTTRLSGVEALYSYRISENERIMSKSASVDVSGTMAALLIWAAMVPGVATLVLSAQYAGYRWRRHKHHKQRVVGCQPSPAIMNSMHSAAVTPTRSMPAPPASTKNAAPRSSRSSMHTSVGSIGSDSFLEPHELSVPHNLKSQFQHHYFRTSAVSSPVASSPPPRFAEGYSPFQHHHHSPQSSSPEYTESWHSMQGDGNNTSNGGNSAKSLQKIRARTIQRQDSASSIASSETASSSSTSSDVPSPVSPTRVRAADPSSESLPGTPLNQSFVESSSLAQFELPTVLPPPPVHVFKKCEELVMFEKAAALLDVAALPEIAPMGDFLSKFTVRSFG
ncbi:hypothetical protein BGZ65_007413 [Modicella reniformis]|uniref:Uncharacterized protein n=1 Tax=Modicella reniformis TaxID=1440133 RepID=A0A9P6JKG3_9FUNG|nr:hypothetical protein BGZ65_007413 [Modicella reniformis]